MTRREYEAGKNKKPADKRLNDNAGAVQFARSQCRACNKQVVFATNKAINPETNQPRDTTLPLDAQAAVYAVRMINHSTVCVPARDYVKSRAGRITEANRQLTQARTLLSALVQDLQAAASDPVKLQLVRDNAVELLAIEQPKLDSDDDVAFYVTHFATCPSASRFSGKGKGPKEG